MRADGHRDAVPGYAPHEVTLDEHEFGFVSTEVTSELGSCVARHLPTRTSSTATIFLHGASGAWTTWTPLLATARELGVTFENPVLLDLPGWGDARITTDIGDVTVPAISSLVKALAEELGFTEWNLVGHSLGGFVALHMASIWPDAIKSVRMISGTTFSVIRSVDHPVRGLVELPAFAMLLPVMRILRALGSVGAPVVRAAGRAGLLRLIFGPLFRHPRAIRRSVFDATERDLRPRAFVAAAGVAKGYDAVAWWRDIRCPLWATRGDRDVFVTAGDLEELGRLLPRSRRSVIADCGHFANVERPREVLDAFGFLST